MTNAIRAALAACLLGAGAAQGADLMPLQAGNTWTYRESVTGQEFTVRVGTPVMTNERVYHSLSGYVGQRLLVRMDERDALVYLDEESGAERLLTSFQPFEGGWWNAPFRQCEQEGQTLEKPGVHDGEAGPIRQVLELRYRSFSCADAGVESEQYAANIGMVRRVVSSIAGPREFNLVYARVARQIVDAQPHGRFTVSIGATARLRLQVNSPAAVVLRFATAQEYELVLRDEAGSVVWKWSDGQMFAQSSHERSVAGEWLMTVDVPWPTQAGRYTLQAWLTTATDAPQYAATVPLRIGGEP
jgi:Intracellular proteinase inhibitor